VKGIVLVDVTPLSLGIETMGGVFTKLIERNTAIPTERSQIFTTAADGQTSVEVHVQQGEREFVKDNKTLGRFHLDGIPPAPRGVPQVEVTFDINANGIVNVTATDKGTGKKQHITITASTSMSKDDIDRAVREAEQHADEDRKRREDVDARNQADQMIYQSRKALEELGDKVTEDEKKPVLDAVAALEEALKGTDPEAVRQKTEELQKSFYAISEKLYQQNHQDPGAPGGEGAEAGPGGPEVVDADFEVVEEDKEDQ